MLTVGAAMPADTLLAALSVHERGSIADGTTLK
jgi:hypothetical protein